MSDDDNALPEELLREHFERWYIKEYPNSSVSLAWHKGNRFNNARLESLFTGFKAGIVLALTWS